MSYNPLLRPLSASEARRYNGEVDPAAVARRQKSLLAGLTKAMLAVEYDKSKEAEIAISELRTLLQQWNAARAGHEGAVG